jgi:hypothetical protein
MTSLLFYERSDSSRRAKQCDPQITQIPQIRPEPVWVLKSAFICEICGSLFACGLAALLQLGCLRGSGKHFHFTRHLPSGCTP